MGKRFPLRNVTENMILKAVEQRWTLSLASAEESENRKTTSAEGIL